MRPLRRRPLRRGRRLPAGDRAARRGFLHHDGGLEESLHRIDGVLAAADLVICQAGCISHNAYWRVKEQCKRTGKPCVFVKRSGVSSFGRVLANLRDEDIGMAANEQSI